MKKINIKSKRFKSTVEAQTFKRKVRASKQWAELRTNKRKQQNDIDPITQSRLSKSANLHHLSTYSVDFYDDLNPERFKLLNQKTHDAVHFLFDIVLREGNFDVFYRLQSIIVDMLAFYYEDEKRYGSSEHFPNTSSR